MDDVRRQAPIRAKGMDGGGVVAEVLQSLGIRYVFGVPRGPCGATIRVDSGHPTCRAIDSLQAIVARSAGG